MLVKQLLLTARTLIAVRSRWIKGDSARTRRGAPTTPMSPDAHCFCALGAIKWACGNLELPKSAYSEATHRLRMAIGEEGGFSIVKFNDLSKTSHADVLAKFDEAILTP